MPGAGNPQAKRPFTAVVLAGGASRRMGRDKARLPYRGVTLLERQLRLLRELGAGEVLIAARSPEDYRDLGVPVLADTYTGQGPLAGLERALQAAGFPGVLVLAVDLPRMTSALLEQVLQACHGNRGAVPRVGGRIEPLAACYPKSAHGTVVRLLDSDQNSARAFALACADQGLVRWLDLPEVESVRFANWNRPEDTVDRGA